MTARRSRSGYTLLELVMVCAVLTILGSLIVPSLGGLSGSYKMNAAVDTVRSAWAQARGRAIEESRPYRFAVIPGSGKYRIAPDQPEFWGGGSGSSSSSQKALVVEESLPKGVSFSASASSSAAGGAGGSGQDGPAASGGDYAVPIVFLPDGTAREDAEVQFQVRGAKTTTLCLRALTGAVTVKRARQGGR
jgi:Tfp pilus assembly protein FimT